MNSVVERKYFLILTPETADCDRPLGGFAFAHDEDGGNLAERVFSHLIVNFFVTDIQFRPQSGATDLRAQSKMETSVQRKKEQLKRLRIVEAFRHSGNRPA